MFGIVRRLYPTAFGAIFLGLTAINAASWRSPILGGALLAGFVVVFGSWVGRWAAPRERGVIRAWVGAWTLLSAVMLAGTACYYLGTFSRPAALFLALAAGPAAWMLAERARRRDLIATSHDLVRAPRHRVPARTFAAFLAGLAALGALARILAAAATDEPVRGVWTRVPPVAFLAAFAAFATLAALALRGRERAFTVTLTGAALAAFLGVTTLAFPIGYGFDPFIHEATITHIAEYGTIDPKPFYYVGYYALALFAHHAFALPVAPVNVALVLALAAFLLPVAWYSAAAHLLRDRKIAAATLPAIFLLPLSTLTLSTPQALANLWTVLLVLAAVPSLARGERPRAWPLFIPALAALAAHPIAGIPAALFVAVLACDPARSGSPRAARAVRAAIVAVGSVALPLSFAIQSMRATGTAGIDLGALARLDPRRALDALAPAFDSRFHPALDFAYFLTLNAVALWVATAVAGWWFSRRQMRGALQPYAALAAMLAINGILLSTVVDFSFLIDYERQNFAARLIPLAQMFLAPFVILAAGLAADRVRSATGSLRLFAAILFAAVATSALYGAYPRDDAYVRGRGFNVGRADLDAVRSVESDAAGTPYAALANQSVSAAAMREIGFARSFGDQYAYPIPTGGDFYEYFLRMNERPTRETASDAATLLEALCAKRPGCEPPRALYYLVNDYWWEAPRIVESAKGSSDAWWSLDNGSVHVFRYNLTP